MLVPMLSSGGMEIRRRRQKLLQLGARHALSCKLMLPLLCSFWPCLPLNVIILCRCLMSSRRPTPYRNGHVRHGLQFPMCSSLPLHHLLPNHIFFHLLRFHLLSKSSICFWVLKWLWNRSQPAILTFLQWLSDVEVIDFHWSGWKCFGPVLEVLVFASLFH